MTDTAALANILIARGAPGKRAPAALRWLAEWLPDADRRTLDKQDLARIDAYAGEAEDLHAMLAAVLPLACPVWFETTVTAQGGTTMMMGYGAAPAQDGVDIGWACMAPAHERILGPLGPCRVTTAAIERPAGVSDESWRALRTAAGIVIRALLLRLGTPVLKSPPDMLATVGRVLYGEHWRMAFSRGVGVDDDTVRRWMSGRTALAAAHGVFDDALDLLQRRRTEIEAAEQELAAWMEAARSGQ